ncbi:MAG: bifunctional phosphopantothenoylcysteine decarboxylase/phosphopantothenate--cysteine ligase CoaBC [Candidatus Sericytochromatia bacterium]|nr:bifunctional phosphopantothenoylcysteine decarboxylase/phosphopantothenate--cysteine ligase CoaBC [Candidatus Sericytochromatia bacterium]
MSHDHPLPPDYWEPLPPMPSALSDHAVPPLSDVLAGRQIALLVCGGIAAFKTPLLARALRKHGAEVTVFASEDALRYVTPDALAWSSDRSVVRALSARAEHLGDGQRFDAYLVAPATYNTINKFAAGMADNLITTVLASALGQLERGQTRILLAPTLHGSMHNTILTQSLLFLQELGVTVLPPRDAYGKHNLPDETEIVYRTARALSHSPLRGLPVLVTGGPTPVPLDDIRRITTRFTGALGCEIAKALFVTGAQVHWVHGQSTFQPPDWLPCTIVDSLQAYQDAVMQILAFADCRAAIFSAAVADYAPARAVSGKIPSGQPELKLSLQSTAKVVQQVRESYPELLLVSFKYEVGLSHAELMQIARQRLAQSDAVVANRAEEQSQQQQAWLVTSHAPEQRLQGKPAIAAGIVAWLEEQLTAESVESLELDDPLIDLMPPLFQD